MALPTTAPYRPMGRATVPPPFLFARNGRLELQLLELTADHARASVAKMPPGGSAAVLSRNGVRAIATVSGADGEVVSLAFDAPLSAWELSQIGGATVGSACRPG